MLPDDCHPERAVAAVPVVLEVGGRAFVVPPADPADAHLLYAEFRRQFMAASADPLDLANARIAAAEKAGRPFSATVIGAMVKEAMSAGGREEGKAEPSVEEVMARIHTLPGSQFSLWLRLRRADPSVTLDWVRQAVPDMAARHAAFTRLAEIDGLGHLDPKKATPTG